MDEGMDMEGWGGERRAVANILCLVPLIAINTLVILYELVLG